jgi:hypothetical protein
MKAQINSFSWYSSYFNKSIDFNLNLNSTFIFISLFYEGLCFFFVSTKCKNCWTDLCVCSIFGKSAFWRWFLEGKIFFWPTDSGAVYKFWRISIYIDQIRWVQKSVIWDTSIQGRTGNAAIVARLFFWEC